jgi:hypothetical protein
MERLFPSWERCIHRHACIFFVNRVNGEFFIGYINSLGGIHASPSHGKINAKARKILTLLSKLFLIFTLFTVARLLKVATLSTTFVWSAYSFYIDDPFIGAPNYIGMLLAFVQVRFRRAQLILCAF